MKKIQLNTKNKNSTIETKKFFYQNFFYIEKGVFLPRFETEQLVDLTIKYAHNFFDHPIKILEMGCGSGVIALNLAMQSTTWAVDAVDISAKALTLCQKNLQIYPQTKVKFWKSDLFEQIKGKYHLIVANLPYVAINFPIKKEILEQDPANALFAGIDGLKIIKKFLQEISPYLHSQHIIALEYGYNQKKLLHKLIKKHLPTSYFIFKQDYAQKHRFVFIYSNRKTTTVLINKIKY